MEGRFRQREQTGREKQKAKGADCPRECEDKGTRLTEARQI